MQEAQHVNKQAYIGKGVTPEMSKTQSVVHNIKNITPLTLHMCLCSKQLLNNTAFLHDCYHISHFNSISQCTSPLFPYIAMSHYFRFLFLSLFSFQWVFPQSLLYSLYYLLQTKPDPRCIYRACVVLGTVAHS